jgi:hypothetical protein
MKTINPLNYYQQKVEHLNKKVNKTKKSLALIMMARLLAFLSILFSVYLVTKYHEPWAYILASLFTAGFVYFIIKHKNKQYMLKKYLALLDQNNLEIKSLQGDYSSFGPGAGFVDPAHPYTFDLDIFGEASVFQYINRTGTLAGERKLAEWFIKPHLAKDQITKLQGGVKELAGKVDWRQEFYARGSFVNHPEGGERDTRAWLNEAPHFSRKIVYRIGRFILPLGLWAYLAGVLVLGWPVNTFFVIFISLLVFANHETKKISQVERQVNESLRALKKYAIYSGMVEGEDYSSPLLQELQAKLFHEGTAASHKLHRLARLFNSLESRQNLMANILMNGLFLYHLHVLIKIEKWREKYRQDVPGMLFALKNVDALNSLANFSFNHPAYTWPIFCSDETYLDTRALAHPLLSPAKRVANDFSMAQPVHSVLITGPNMAGKSTFLRAVGVNMILAMMGAPVCAGKFAFQPMYLFSSMRTSDSLTRDQSFFQAEISRLAGILEYFKNKGRTLVILDEILKGTNTRDKEIGSRKFLEKMIRMGIPAIVATHDLSLGQVKKSHPGKIDEKSFEIQFDDDNIRYPYKLSDGPTEQMNAILLMKKYGILDG